LKIIARQNHGASKHLGFRIQTLGMKESHHSERGCSFGDAQAVIAMFAWPPQLSETAYREAQKGLVSKTAETDLPTRPDFFDLFSTALL